MSQSFRSDTLAPSELGGIVRRHPSRGWRKENAAAEDGVVPAGQATGFRVLAFGFALCISVLPFSSVYFLLCFCSLHPTLFATTLLSDGLIALTLFGSWFAVFGCIKNMGGNDTCVHGFRWNYSC